MNHLNALRLGAIAAGLALAGSAQAHYLWLEQDNKTATLYFGGFGENLREASPGKLDNMLNPSFRLLSASGERAVEATKTANGYRLASRAGAGESLVAEVSQLPVSEKKDGDKTVRSAPTRAARFIGDFSAQAPKLALDVVPTGRSEAGAVEFQVLFKGQALPKLKLNVELASGWELPRVTDEQGKFSLALPWAGAYVIDVRHLDSTPGERGGVAYDVANYRTTLSLLQLRGLKQAPAGPLRAPAAATASAAAMAAMPAR
jgi:uncharacterized GH25 family protein